MCMVQEGVRLVSQQSNEKVAFLLGEACLVLLFGQVRPVTGNAASSMTKWQDVDNRTLKIYAQN